MGKDERQPFQFESKTRDGKVKELSEKLKQGVRDVFQSKRYVEYLSAMAKFYQYSPSNVCLIVSQKPDASLVASYTKWEKDFGRHVKPGEKSIKIFAPILKKRALPTGEPVDKVKSAPELEPENEEEKVRVSGYVVVNVFDVSQTEGREIPSIGVSRLEGSVDRYKDMLEALKDLSPVPVSFKPISSSANGFYNLEEKSITVREGMSEKQTIKTLVHEITHATLHDVDLSSRKLDPEFLKNANTREVEAESTAFIVCKYFGLDVDDYSFGYVAGWSSDKKTEELLSSLETIKKASNTFIQKIESRLMIPPEKEKSVGIRATIEANKEKAATKEPTKPSKEHAIGKDR